MAEGKKVTKEQIVKMIDNAMEVWHKLDRIELHVEEIRNDLQSVVKGLNATFHFDPNGKKQ